MRPTEGLLSNKVLKDFLNRLKKNGSKFSYRKIQNKSKKVYEANITIFDALKKLIMIMVSLHLKDIFLLIQ